MAFAKMFYLFSKFQQGVGVLARSTTFAKIPRQLQFEADINKLFMFTSYNRLGRDAEEADAEEIIEMAGKATFSEQEKLVQENIHYQVANFCSSMDEILLRDEDDNVRTAVKPVVPETKPLKLVEVSRRLKDRIGYSLEIKPSLIPHKDAGQGCFVEGEADVGAVLAFYPGVIYSPAFYRCIPGYPNVHEQNSYLITRYDGTVINTQHWGQGGESREVWNDYITTPEVRTDANTTEYGSDKEGSANRRVILEMRNPLAFGHFVNHPGKDMDPNVMICPYDFPLSEREMRPYIPNVAFGNSGDVKMSSGKLWFKTQSNSGLDAPVLKTVVLVATRALCNEELMLNYRLTSSEGRPDWYSPINEEEDQMISS